MLGKEQDAIVYRYRLSPIDRCVLAGLGGSMWRETMNSKLTHSSLECFKASHPSGQVRSSRNGVAIQSRLPPNLFRCQCITATMHHVMVIHGRSDPEHCVIESDPIIEEMCHPTFREIPPETSRTGWNWSRRWEGRGGDIGREYLLEPIRSLGKRAVSEPFMAIHVTLDYSLDH
ncbi:uncharacterized protein BO97DRAFT_212167 [Aspergillus homomorphus CBS 101889]|uniref:Uncharacterized protein n=1 Tax=Aspergillus homomorphus (strain CBS 101889) TaxID=1450537 RepID=A0A395I5R5_ASPHC|nr:hypothetical protein BO97DRAFT_212167 [Aspergillus homomorphus CBS 101889]RAL15440.1 hypothetical protein BO97DRAFT_212167 [Aspergillus homomorphus CBS 101889]